MPWQKPLSPSLWCQDPFPNWSTMDHVLVFWGYQNSFGTLWQLSSRSIQETIWFALLEHWHGSQLCGGTLLSMQDNMNKIYWIIFIRDNKLILSSWFGKPAYWGTATIECPGAKSWQMQSQGVNNSVVVVSSQKVTREERTCNNITIQ
jgi:hypothetical protein